MKRWAEAIAIGLSIGIGITVIHEVLRNEGTRKDIENLVNNLKEEKRKKHEEQEFKKAQQTGDSELNRKITEQQWEAVLSR